MIVVALCALTKCRQTHARLLVVLIPGEVWRIYKPFISDFGSKMEPSERLVLFATALLLASTGKLYRKWEGLVTLWCAGGGQPSGPHDCLETATVSNEAALTVSDGVVCFQCDLGSGIVSDASFTLNHFPVPSQVGATVNGTLVIFDTGSTFQSLAFVGCSNGGQSTVFSVVSLGQFLPPLIEGDSCVREGESLSLGCNANNSHPLPSVVWFSPLGLQLSEDRSLVVDNISRSEAGNYSCVATNSSMATQSSSVTVSVECKSAKPLLPCYPTTLIPSSST